MGSLRTDAYSGAAETLLREALNQGVFAIGRFQNHRSLSLTVTAGVTEQIQSAAFSGMAVQVFTHEGHAGFASSNVVDAETATALVRRAAGLARASAALDAERNTEFRTFQSRGREQVIPPQPFPFEAASIPEMEGILSVFNRGAAYDPRLAVRTAFGLYEDDWRVVRSDGRDVSFRIPRAAAYNTISARGNGRSASGRASTSGAGLELLLDGERVQQLEKRTRSASELCSNLLEASRVKSGHYRIVIDYALAKGLAHEAFGHAAEADYMEESILGDSEGRFRTGQVVAAPFVSIEDGPITGDYAYQPVGANGEPRQQVTIIEHGVLRSALADQFSAARAGVKAVGADRAESYLHIPCPRMSNIRLIVDNPLPLDRPGDEVTPSELKAILEQNGLRQKGETVLYLTGYKGGQVDPAHGDFVFNCTGIYRLDDTGTTLHLPAIFSGKVLSALGSIAAGIGPVLADAMGTCGKRGQGVPSSGGSHAFLVINANDEITIGGE